MKASIFSALLFLYAFAALGQTAPTPGLSTGCSLEFAAIGAPNTTRLLAVQDEIFPQIEEKALAARQAAIEERGATPGFVAYFNALDEGSRAQKNLPDLLLQQALNRLPSLRGSHFNLVVSGGVVDSWTPTLLQAAERRGVSLSVIQLPGGISDQPGRVRNSLPKFSPEVVTDLRAHPTIFFDDSYSQGTTARIVRKGVEEAGGRVDGVFVAYDGGKGNPSSLFKSGRAGKIGSPNFDCFARPTSWQARPDTVIAVELEGTILLGQTLLPQGKNFLGEMEKSGVPLVFLRQGKKVKWPAALRTQFPRLREANPEEKISVALGNWGRVFLGAEPVTPTRRGVIKNLQPRDVLEVAFLGERSALPDPLAEPRGFGLRITENALSSQEPFAVSLPKTDVSPDYLLDRLSDLGWLKPLPADPRPVHVAGTSRVHNLRTAAHFDYDETLRRLNSSEPMQQESRDEYFSWRKFPEPARQRLLAAAGNLPIPTEAWINVIYGSNDPRFVPLLERWRKSLLSPVDDAFLQKVNKLSTESKEKYVKDLKPVQRERLFGLISAAKLQERALKALADLKPKVPEPQILDALARGENALTLDANVLGVAERSRDVRFLPLLERWQQNQVSPAELAWLNDYLAKEKSAKALGGQDLHHRSVSMGDQKRKATLEDRLRTGLKINAVLDRIRQRAADLRNYGLQP